jgi:FtsP/CotA-like multicopper oxidase with cupredoxin domain
MPQRAGLNSLFCLATLEAMSSPAPALSRRQFLSGLGVSCLALPTAGGAQDGEFRTIRARPGSVHLRGHEQSPTGIWGYDGTVPGPLLRVKRGEEVKVRLTNDLPEPTSVHWHGLRLPNAMDGVPHLTQSPIEPGQSFDYRFKAMDAGTYWYHSHVYSSEQVERGLYGALIVDEADRLDVDQDILLVVDDWRLLADGTLDTASLRSMHDAAHAGRIGRHLTINSAPTFDIPVKANERLRLRIINAANARVMTLRLERHAARVMAIDGQPAEPFLARDSQVTLGPGNRVDLFVDATLAPGARAPILVENFGTEVPLAELRYATATPARSAPRPEARSLPANALPARMAFKDAFRLDVPLEGGAMSELMMRGRGQDIPGHGIDPRARIWTMAGAASSGHHGPPMFSVKRGRVVMLGFVNNTAFPHGMHVHGHHFRLLDKNDDGWKPFWLDSVVVAARETARIAFVADNPGKWMLHCHMLEHQETGMAAWFAVT